MLHTTKVSGKKVSKVIGMVNQVTNRGRYNFMLSKCRSFQDNFSAKISNQFVAAPERRSCSLGGVSTNTNKHRCYSQEPLYSRGNNLVRLTKADD